MSGDTDVTLRWGEFATGGKLLSELTGWISSGVPGAVLIEEEAEVPSGPTADHSSEVLL